VYLFFVVFILYNGSGGNKMEKLMLKKCFECGALVRVIHPCHCDDCGIVCCGKSMEEVKVNSVDASFEKHVPTYEVVDGNIIVTVNHVMEEDHYIEWISLVSAAGEECIYLKPGVDAKVTFYHKTNGILYAYCNKHGLWENEIK